MVVKFKCEYSGKNFLGFQRQSRGRSVQQELETAIGRYLGVTDERVVVSGSGRTDAGVHAREQVCSFNIDLRGKNAGGGLVAFGESDLFKMTTAINAFLPDDVAVRDFEVAPNGFHARYSAKRKTYLYRVYVSPFRSPMRDEQYHQIYKMPDMEQMRVQAAGFVGKKDFREYCAGVDASGAVDGGTDLVVEKDFVREIFRFDIEQRGDELWFWVTGDGFLRKMVRIMVGVLLFGQKQTAPAKGLTLWSVEY